MVMMLYYVRVVSLSREYTTASHLTGACVIYPVSVWGIPKKSLGLSILCPHNYVSSVECGTVCVVVDVLSLPESGSLSVVVTVCVVM